VTNLLVDMLTEELVARELTQEEFAHRLKMPLHRIEEVFRGERPTAILLEKVAILFGCSSGFLRRLSEINLDDKGMRVGP
jgi:transcriptional regulator with XRE-family HTH domain